MVIASHGVFATYGFWPPNDPRGSWSDRVWAEHLQRFGEATKVNTRASLAKKPFDRNLRRQIDDALLYPKVRLNLRQRELVAQAYAEICETLHLKIYALVVMEDHTHFVSARHAEDVETLIGFLKRAAARRLNANGVHPLAGYRDSRDRIPSCWVRGGWKRYLNTPAEISSAIDYVRANPGRAGLAPQRYAWETPFVWEKASHSRDG